MRGLAAAMVLLCGVARAKDEPPRWRIRAALIQGFGGSYDQSSVAAFPTTLELGVRIWGPLSAVAGATGVLSGDSYIACGEQRRANAILGNLGLRVDFNNKKGDSWLDPFVEAHGGIGQQEGGRQGANGCPRDQIFGTGGVRGGLDVWLGKVAVTVAVGFDWVPIAPPASGYLGATFLLQ